MNSLIFASQIHTYISGGNDNDTHTIKVKRSFLSLLSAKVIKIGTTVLYMYIESYRVMQKSVDM